MSKEAEIEKLKAKLAQLNVTDGHKSILSDPNATVTVYYNIDEAAKTLIEIRNGQLNWLEGFISSMHGHEATVNGVKTGTTTVAVVATCLLFTPLAAFGVAGLITSGVAGAATGVGDLIANQVKNSQVDERVNASKEAEDELTKAIAECQKVIDEIVNVTGVDKEMAESIFHAIVSHVKQSAAAGVTISSGFVAMATCGPALANMTALARAGVPVAHAARLVAATSTASAGGRVALDVGRTAAGQAATVAAKSLAVLGAVVSVADCIMSWVNGNPTKNGAIDLKKQLTTSRDELLEYRKHWAPYVINVKVE